MFETSPKGGTKINSSRFEWISDDGSTINIINYRGDWDGNNTYHKNDQVNHNNAVWVCVANSGVDVTAEPSDGSSYWKKVLSGGKGDKGDKGEDGLSGNGIVPAYIRSNDNPTPPTSTDKNNLDNGWSLAIPSVADVKNVSYSDSSWTDYNDGSYTWKKSPTTADNSTSWCLVTFTTTQANQAVMFVIKSFSEPMYDYIFLSEIDAASAPSRPTSNGWYRAVSGNGVELSVTDIVATAGTHTVYVCYGKDNSSSFHGDYGLFRIEKMTDIDIPLWQSNGKEVFTRNDSGAIKSKIESWSEPFKVTGEDGAEGEQGESALEIIVTPETLVFDTNDYGLVPPETSKQASISCYRNGVKVTNVSYDKSEEENCLASVSESNGSATVTISKITSQEVADTSGNSSTISSTISNTSGYTTIQVWDKDTNLYHRVQVKFMVNVAKFTGQMVNTNKRFSNTLTEVSTKVDDKVGSSDLTQFKSEITQTAREISLSVSEKSIGRRNLLVGSAFNRQEGFGLLLDANVRGYGILMNDGVDGMNCIKVASYYDGTRHQYCGAFWGGNHTKNIRIKHGTKYTFSCWVKVLYANTTVYLEVIYNRAEIGNDRDGSPTGTYYFAIKEPNKWQLVKWSFTTDDTHDWIEANVFTSSDVAYKTFVASFCKPMLEEGDYNGWTLSEQDYDYVGGNLLDNARTLDKSGMLVVINDTVIQNGYGTDSACAKNLMQANATLSDYKEVLRWIFGSTYLVNGNDYIFSFVAKADVDDARVVCYMWSGDIENSCDIFTEGNGETWDSRSDGNVVFILSRQWTRYWVHWRPNDGYATPKEVIIRHTGNNSTSASTVYVTQPKLEIGATMTEWTERKTDLVDKASLKKAGIEITSEQVTLYGNKVQVKNPKANPSEGYDEAAMFQNGKLNAQFINAGDIVAEGINAQKITATKLNVTGDSKIGIWHIKKVDGWGDIMQAEGTEYNGTTVVSGIQYCPLFVRGGSLLTDYFRVGVSCTEFSYTSGNNDFSAVWLGNAARIVCKGSSNAMNLPTNYAYNTQYEPVHYIYSEQSKKDSPALAINVIAKGFTGTPTALQTNGAIRGVIAPNLRIMNYSGQISSSDCIVIVTKGGITLKLPAGPIVGQTLLIYSKVSSNVYIEYDSSGGYGTGKMYSDGSLQTKIEIGRAGTFTYFIFDGENWCYAYFNGSHNSV